MKTYKNFEDYFSYFDKEIIEKLEQIRTEIKNEIPEVEECIKYAMPTFTFKIKNLIHFAAYKNHIGIYPGSEAIVVFEKELENYKTSKGSIQIPLSSELPLELINKIANYRKSKILQSTKPLQISGSI
ncbi:iron chaperone [Epilithonimonas sp.]|uniref:iron chaperone n=1 Tax=Epilithonimonas sp. TaxID=2894511 RepID=UPI002FDF0432